MLRVLRTLPALRLRTGLLPEAVASLIGGNRSVRPMAVPMRHALMPMAVPIEQPGPSKASQMVAVGALALALSGLWGQEQVIAVTRVALDGLRSSQAHVADIDAADLPAMDPGLAQIVDPRTRPVAQIALRTRQVAVQPFEYDVRDGETLQDIAARFGTDVGALLWNNGLDSADQVTVGARLTILPVRGVLHLVKPDDTLAAIAERYGSSLEDLILANALERADAIVPGQIVVVAGGAVPAAIAQAQASAESAHLQSSEIVGESGLTALGTAIERRAEETVAEVLPEPPDAAGWQRDFIMSIAPGARASQRKSGVPASVTLAQAILESDWGRSKLTREANNLFGIKAFTRPGSSGVYEINTWEVYGGQSVTVFAAFRAYASLADSIADHGNWFHDNDRYHRALDVKDDPRAFARAINAAGYATDPAYAPKLIGLMDRFNLYAYDVTPPTPQP